MSIIRLDNGRWYTKGELARRLDVSKRTITNYVHKGTVQKRQTPTGVVFRVSTEETEAFPPEGNGKESPSPSNHAGVKTAGKGETETEISARRKAPCHALSTHSPQPMPTLWRSSPKLEPRPPAGAPRPKPRNTRP